MLLTKTTDAWSEMCELYDSGEIEDMALFEAINDNMLSDALDNIVSHEFPNGCDIYELTRFFNEEGELIAQKLHIEDYYSKRKSEYED